MLFFDDIDDVIYVWEFFFKDVFDIYIFIWIVKIRKESFFWVIGEIRKEMNKWYKLLRKCDGMSNIFVFWEEYKRIRNKVIKMLCEVEFIFWLN